MNENLMFVSAAFVVTWGVLVGYFVHLHRTLRRARTLLDTATNAGAR
jgi:hypothetical protein